MPSQPVRQPLACRGGMSGVQNAWTADAQIPTSQSPAKQHTQKAVERRDGLHALQTLQYMQALHTQSNASSSIDCHYVAAHQHKQQQRYQDVSYAAVLQHCPLNPTRCCMHQMPIHSATTEGCGGCAGESRHNPVWHLGPSQVTYVGMVDTQASAPAPSPPIPYTKQLKYLNGAFAYDPHHKYHRRISHVTMTPGVILIIICHNHMRCPSSLQETQLQPRCVGSHAF